jgi:hypothetical protein
LIKFKAQNSVLSYVDSIAKRNETTIVAGGFTHAKITRQKKPAPQIPTGFTGKTTGNGKIEIECGRIGFAKFYGAVCSTSPASLNNIFKMVSLIFLS